MTEFIQYMHAADNLCQWINETYGKPSIELGDAVIAAVVAKKLRLDEETTYEVPQREDDLNRIKLAMEFDGENIDIAIIKVEYNKTANLVYMGTPVFLSGMLIVVAQLNSIFKGHILRGGFSEN